MNRFLQVLNILFSAALLALAIPNVFYHFGSPLIGFFALIPFYKASSKCKSYLESALAFAFFTFMTQLFSSYWLGLFKDFAFVTLFFTCFGTSLEGFAAGLFFYIPFARTGRTRTLRETGSPLYSSFVPMRIFWFSAVYTSYEWIKSCGFLGYPWGTVSMSQYRFSPFIQIADITGTYGITFLCVMFSAVFWEIFVFMNETSLNAESKSHSKKRKYFPPSEADSFSARKAFFPEIFSQKRFLPLKRTLSVWILLMSVSIVYGTFQLAKKRPPVKYLNTIMVQQNKDPWKTGSDNETIRISMRLTEKALEEAKKNGEEINLVVWSEGCLRYPFPQATYHYKNYPREESLESFIKRINVPFILGGSYVINESPRQSVNATILYDEEGKFRGYYGKLHLVPFAEVVPFADIPKAAVFMREKLGLPTGWHPGLQYVLYDIKCRYPEEKQIPEVNVISLKDSFDEQKEKENESPFVRISTPICYDDSFPDVCTPLSKNGSEILMNLTDNSWSGTETAEYQHFVVSSFRAIELRTTLARSTNSGYSVVVSPSGKILGDLPLFEEASGFFKIPVFKRESTVYSRLGNWLPHTLVIFALFTGILEWLKKDENPEVPSERKKLKAGKTKKSGKKAKSGKKK